jgi:hypothetical protein
MACSWWHTRDLTFRAHSGRRGGFTVDGAYWKRPNELRNKVKVNSTQMGYNSGAGCFDSKAEAELHVHPFQIFVEQYFTEAGGGAGGGGAERKKMYSEATREDTRSGGRDEDKAEDAFSKRPIKEPGGGQAKKQKVPLSLEATMRARRAQALTNMKEQAARRLQQYYRRTRKVAD